MQTAMKRSKQRDAILAYLKTRTDHPTADMVYTELRKTMPNISLGTVYRNLSQLAEYGIILRISCDGKVDHFDATVTPHPHFFCTKCGCVLDFPLSELPSFVYTPESFNGRVDGCHIIYYGHCEACCQSMT